MVAIDVAVLVCFVLIDNIDCGAGLYCAFTGLEQKKNPFVVITGLSFSCADSDADVFV